MNNVQSIFTSVLIASSLVLFLSFRLHASFGVFQIPIAAELNWFRSEFSLAIAIQNQVWGWERRFLGLLPNVLVTGVPFSSAHCSMQPV